MGAPLLENRTLYMHLLKKTLDGGYWKLSSEAALSCVAIAQQKRSEQHLSYIYRHVFCFLESEENC